MHRYALGDIFWESNSARMHLAVLRSCASLEQVLHGEARDDGGDGGGATTGASTDTPSASSRAVAVKAYKAVFESWEQLTAKPEIRILSGLAHPCVVKLREVIREGPTGWAVLDLMPLTLRRFVELCREHHGEERADAPTAVTSEPAAAQGGLPSAQLRLLGFQLLSGLQHLHENRVAHCALSPDSVLVRDNESLRCVKIGCFSEAVQFQDEASSGMGCAAAAAPPRRVFQQDWRRWTAPEVAAAWDSDAPFVGGFDVLHAADVWSAGSVLAFAMGGDIDSLLPQEARDEEAHHGEPVVFLLRRLLHQDSKARPTAAEALADPYFSDWFADNIHVDDEPVG